MPGDELFKRYLEIGASVLGMSRDRAESIVRDLVASGEVAKGQATKAADWLVERGRSGSEEVAELVRREIRQQVTALGLATKDDVARLQAQIDELRAPPAAAPAAAKKAPARKKAPAAPKPAAAKATAAGGEAAGITRSGSVRKRPGASGAAKPGAAPPAGGADPAKG
jgi:polyhydroxyalkanoate synthesis regulator phasin